jgi:rubrerythrin
MKKITEDNLKAAFAGESQAYMRYLIFADKAEEEGFPNVARLFRAIAHAERVHATNHFRTLAMLQRTSGNLQAAIDGETFEVDEMYPAYKAVAELQEEKSAYRSADWALQAEKVHAGLYQKARQSVEREEDVTLGPVFICGGCGYTAKGSAPEKCPVCGAPREKFKKF